MQAHRTSAPAVLPAATPSFFDALFNEHARTLGAVACRVLGSRSDADEVVQDVFVEVMRHPDRIKAASSARAWLITMVVRMAKRRLWRRKWLTAFGLRRGPEVDAAELMRGPARVEDHTLIQQVYKVLDQLPIDSRVAWLLRHVQDEPIDVISTILGCSAATTKRRIAQAQLAIEDATEAGAL